MKRVQRIVLTAVLTLGWTAPAWADYNPGLSTDPNLAGWWRFEQNRNDSSGSDNWLSDNGGESYSETLFREGLYSFTTYGLFFLYRTDADLSANFPFKDGTSNTNMSICFWFRIQDLPALSDGYVLVSKNKTNTDDSSFQVSMWRGAGDERTISLSSYYNESGDETESGILSYTYAASVWYHLGVTLGSDKSWRIRLYDTSTETVSQNTGTFTNATVCEPARFQWAAGNSTGNFLFHGNLDEGLVFNDVLSSAEIDSIRKGEYGNDLDQLRRDWWWRRRHSN
jgi:hypothetical protein